jgi:hypothetical protein
VTTITAPAKEHVGMNWFSRRHGARTLLVMLAAMTSFGAPAAESVVEAIPMEPITQIINAFQTHSIVALGDGPGDGDNGNEPGHAFRLSLIRDPRLARAANDIVVGFGNALFQDTLDRFVRGEAVPYDELRKAWQDTPLSADFFNTIRTVNATMPADQGFRVILGDPGKTDNAVAALIREEVLTKGRHALVVYGEKHLLRQSAAPTITSILEGEGMQIFSVWTNTSTDLSQFQPSVAEWPAPSLAMIESTALPLRDQFDAILYVGTPESISYSVPAGGECLTISPPRRTEILEISPSRN